MPSLCLSLSRNLFALLILCLVRCRWEHFTLFRPYLSFRWRKGSHNFPHGGHFNHLSSTPQLHAYSLYSHIQYTFHKLRRMDQLELIIFFGLLFLQYFRFFSNMSKLFYGHCLARFETTKSRFHEIAVTIPGTNRCTTYYDLIFWWIEKKMNYKRIKSTTHQEFKRRILSSHIFFITEQGISAIASLAGLSKH